MSVGVGFSGAGGTGCTLMVAVLNAVVCEPCEPAQVSSRSADSRRDVTSGCAFSMEASAASPDHTLVMPLLSSANRSEAARYAEITSRTSYSTSDSGVESPVLKLS